MISIANNVTSTGDKCQFSLNVAALLLLAGSLTACGGGGSSSGTTTSTSTTDSSIVAAKSVVAQCATPRTGVSPVTGVAYQDTQGSVATEKSWIRAYINDTYLWYSEVPSVTAASYATAVDYFAALKSPATTASGALKDKFHFTYLTTDWESQSTAGITYGYGIAWKLVSSTPPRSLVVTQVTPGSVAAQAGIARGNSILTVDGVDLVNATGTAAVNTLNTGAFSPANGVAHTFTVQATGTTTTQQVTLTAGAVTTVPVQNVKTISTASGNVGYMLFNTHIATAESQLIAAVNQLKAANVVDVVLDLRYNGGGLLALASELAYMIAGPSATTGKTFEKIVFNDKNPFNVTAAQANTPFYATAQGFSTTSGQALPTLGLSRVTVLTSSSTCSASESVINSLRGVGITVNLIGSTTCGKPYGFLPQDNCGVTYFAIQFKGTNALGFGDYTDGFTATCPANDDYTRALGDPLESQLAAALAYRSTGVCSAVSASDERYTARKTVDGGGWALTQPVNPALTNRILSKPL
jgi:carboxyl-terminal processing protease